MADPTIPQPGDEITAEWGQAVVAAIGEARTALVAEAGAGGNVNVTGNAWTKLPLGAATGGTDPGSIAGGTWTVPRDGLYLVQGECVSSGTVTTRLYRLYRNGAGVGGGTTAHQDQATRSVYANVATAVRLSMGDRIEVWTYCNATTATNRAERFLALQLAP